ncbi:unnamed protein product [Schistocephalus solidus]|uniref:C2H2-type domain-containing protein n=1 Tax=Schistocephalus solidus TaxID=70667 RepID=A0A183T7W6_SCHSO|nr:unnamed protein product [Schistocephalus solidus]
MKSNITSVVIPTVLKSEPNETSMSMSELRLYKACLSNGVDVSNWPGHEDVCYKEKIENFRLLNRQARARARRKIMPLSKDREVNLGEANQPMDLSIPENTSGTSSTDIIPMNPPIPPVVMANISGWVLPVQTLMVANELQATNRFPPNASCPPILPRTLMDPPAPSSSSTCFLPPHISLPTPLSDRLASSSSSSSVPSERNHLQASTTTVFENKENQLPQPAPGALPTDPHHAANTSGVMATFSFPLQCKPEDTSQMNEAPTETDPSTEDVLEVQTRIKMDPDLFSDYGHYKVVEPSPNRKSIRLKFKKISPSKAEEEPPGCAEEVKEPTICDICGQDFDSLKRLRAHVRSQHPSDSPYECQECHQKFVTDGWLRSHMEREHGLLPLILGRPAEEGPSTSS